MCLGVPGRIVEMNAMEQWAIIESFGVRNKVYTTLVDQEIVPGDYVMVHAGYAIGKMEAGEAEETLTLLEQVASWTEGDLSPEDEEEETGKGA